LTAFLRAPAPVNLNRRKKQFAVIGSIGHSRRAFTAPQAVDVYDLKASTFKPW
jgi:hypothetical protein